MKALHVAQATQKQCINLLLMYLNLTRPFIPSGVDAGLHCPVLCVVVYLAAIGLAQLGPIMEDWCDATLCYMGSSAIALACLGIHA